MKKEKVIVSDITDENGNRRIEYSCGCVETSGGADYGLRGSAWMQNGCNCEGEEHESY